jgi:hypothetical protein
MREYSFWIAVFGVIAWTRWITSIVGWDCPHPRNACLSICLLSHVQLHEHPSCQ